MTPAYLWSRLQYEPATGKLYWKHHAPHGKAWNTRWAGREAFTAIDDVGYHCGAIDGQLYRAHRVIWAMVTGGWPAEVDHADHVRTNNRIGNLSKSTRVGNTRNQPMRATNTSGMTGVWWYARDMIWVASIGVGGRKVYLGRFEVFDAAVAARKAAEIKYSFHPNHGA